MKIAIKWLASALLHLVLLPTVPLAAPIISLFTKMRLTSGRRVIGGAGRLRAENSRTKAT